MLVTAGGTREPIDPVRFIGNRSSGKQGHALAEEAWSRGAKVTLVTTTDRPVSAGVDVVRVVTAAEMEQAVLARAPAADVVVMAAAVADFRPAQPADGEDQEGRGRARRSSSSRRPTSSPGSVRPSRPGQTLVGFAAETSDVRDHAEEKLVRKGLDLIVANDVGAPNVGFEHDTNQVMIVSAGGVVAEVELADKRAVAAAVFDAIVAHRLASTDLP